jgi:DNA polymerase I-like protein with 3'-5' exonuclease and polymerase domains
MLIDGTPFTDYVETHDAFIPRTMSCRQVGKKSNHALNYMMGTNTFSLTSGLSLEESDRARALYLSAYERLPEWWEEVRQNLKDSHAVINIIGQPRKFLGTIDDKIVKEAVAHLPQSSSVWVVNQAMAKIYEHENYAEILGQVHDSLLFQHSYTDLDALEDFCQIAKEALEPQLTSYGDGVERKFYIETDIKVGFDGAKMYDTTLSNIKETVENLCRLK